MPLTKGKDVGGDKWNTFRGLISKKINFDLFFIRRRFFHVKHGRLELGKGAYDLAGLAVFNPSQCLFHILFVSQREFYSPASLFETFAVVDQDHMDELNGSDGDTNHLNRKFNQLFLLWSFFFCLSWSLVLEFTRLLCSRPLHDMISQLC